MTNDEGGRDAGSVAAPCPTRPILVRIIAGLAAKAWLVILVLVSWPVLRRLLGDEAFGLIGFYLTLQTVLQTLDLGLTPTVVREIARTAGADTDAELAEKASTFETTFAAVAAALAVGVAALAPVISEFWVRRENLSAETVTHCVRLMGLICGAQWLGGFYQSALTGLQRQVLVNALRAGEATLSWLGAIALFTVWQGDVVTFFLWQLGVALLGLIAAGLAFRASVPGVRFAFRLIHLRRASRFALGMAGISILGLILINMDRVYLSHALPLDRFGNYTLAAYTASAGFSAFLVPLSNVFLPRFTALAASEPASLRGAYGLAVKLFAMLALPGLVVALLLGHDFFRLWTGDQAVADAATPPFHWLVAGWTCASLATPAYLMQIAYGWTSLGLRSGTVFVVVFVPLLFVLGGRFGVEGAAANFAAFNVSYLIVNVTLTHRFLLSSAAH